jgi:SNF2 family DNA or RNA helicase
MSVDDCMGRFTRMVLNAGFDAKSYQYDGVKWAIGHERSDAERRGGIIADEMGLGKTVQAIGLIYSHVVRRTLIVLPVALVNQWVKAVTQLTHLKPLLYHGSRRSKISEETFLKAPIVITTYDVVMIDAKKDNSMLHTVVWNRVIYDEAHHLRNSSTTRFKACAALTTEIVWTVTGTPLQNRVNDFYSLCRIIGFEERLFRTTDPETLKRFTDAFILRRTKAEVGIDLPPLTVQDIVVPWINDVEKLLAIDIHKDLDFSNASSIDGDGEEDDSEEEEEEEGSGRLHYSSNSLVMLSMIRARQACVLPSMVFKKGSRSCKVLKNVSSKIDKVVETILMRKDNGSGKLVFCHYVQEIDQIKNALLEGGVETVNTYDGRNSGNKGAFDKADVLILQIQTGCEGLNLQENFSEIYFVSPHWNPAVEDQAVARCYRIGQIRPVFVYRFIMANFQDHEEVREKNEEEEDEEEEDDKVVKTTNIEDYVKQVQTFKRATCSAVLL